MSFLKNRTVVGVICILLSLLICFGLTPLFNQSVSQKAEIVRVVQPIRAGDEITESMVQIVEVGGYNLPEDVLRQKESAVGKYATADLAVGDYTRPDGPASRTRLSAPSRALWPWGALPWCRWNFINSPSRCRPA